MHSKRWLEAFPAPDPISLGLSAATLASISTGASIAGGVTSAAGAVMGGIGASNAYSYKAQVAQNNAKIARQNADYAAMEGGKQAEMQGRQAQFQMGKIISGQAASGVDVNSGTALAIREGQALVNRENQMMIRSNASRKAYGYNVEAMNFEAQAAMDEQAGDNAMTAGVIGGGSSLIGGAASVSDKWLKYKTAGVEGY